MDKLNNNDNISNLLTIPCQYLNLMFICNDILNIFKHVATCLYVHLLFRNLYSVEGRIYGAYDLMSHHVNICMQLAQSVAYSLPQAMVTQYEATS